MGIKVCTQCGGSGPFERDRSKPDGLSCRCKECKKAYRNANKTAIRARNKTWYEANSLTVALKQRVWREKNAARVATRSRVYYEGHQEDFRAANRRQAAVRKDLVDSLKARPCEDCKRPFPPYCMDFDHVRGEKRACVSQMQSANLRDIRSEIEKCDLVCANCHRIRTDIRKGTSQSKAQQLFKTRLDVLKSAPCCDCGQRFHPSAMEFDHVRGEKRMCVSRMQSRPWSEVLEEIAKCDLVCSNCHRIRTQIRRPPKMVTAPRREVA